MRVVMKTVEKTVEKKAEKTVVMKVVMTACQDEPPRQSRPKCEEEDRQKTNRFRPRMEAST